MTSRRGPTGPDIAALNINAIRQVPLLSADDEVRLGQQIERAQVAEAKLGAIAAGEVTAEPTEVREMRQHRATGMVAREELFTGNLRLVLAIANRHPRSNEVEFIDLVQGGAVGLGAAVEGFDWSQGTRFNTYAFDWIRGAVIDTVNEQAPIRIATDRLNAAENAVKKGEATDNDKSVLALQELDSLNTDANDQDDTEKIDLIPSDQSHPEDVIEEIAAQDLIQEILQHLTDQQRRAFVLYFGLETGEPISLEKTGTKMGISKNSASVLVRNGLKTLQQKADWGVLQNTLEE